MGERASSSHGKPRPFVPFTSGDAPQSCSEVGTRPPAEHFQQVLTYVGYVPPTDLDVAMRELAAALLGTAAEVVPPPNAATPAERTIVDVVALDGTLLNLLRWGRIVNDNDVDVGVVGRGIPLDEAPRHYWAAMWALARAGFIDYPEPRHLKRLYRAQGAVKHRRCVMRSQMMQCRHRNGVVVDIFGPETLFSTVTHFTVDDVLPAVACRAFDGTFPCPKSPIKVLKNFTLQHASKLNSVAHNNDGESAVPPPETWYEFAGCSILTPNPKEHTRAHVLSIVRSSRALAQCGFPSLFEDRVNPACAALVDIRWLSDG
jgi:hypothetical protein